MAFDIGAGLSEMGKSVAQTAQNFTLEEHKAELLERAARLADELAGGRQEKQNVFDMSKLDKTISATATENRLTREAEAELKGAQVQHYRVTSAAGQARIDAGKEARDILLEGSSGSAASDSYAKAMKTAETSNRGMINNELGSGAFGPYQFMPGTWGDVRSQNPDLNLPSDMRQGTEEQHKAAFDRLTAANAKGLQKAGFDPTPSNLYLAHRFGVGGATSVLKADPNASLADVLPRDWQTQNPDMRGQTAAGFRRYADEKMKGVTEGVTATGPTKDEKLQAALAGGGDVGQAVEARSRTADRLEKATEHKETLQTQLELGRAIKVEDNGNLISIDTKGRATPVLGVDGKQAKTTDPDKWRAITETARTNREEMRSVNQTYGIELGKAQRVLADAQKNAFGNSKDPTFVKAQNDYDQIRKDFDAQMEPLRAQSRALTNQLLGLTKGEGGPKTTTLKYNAQGVLEPDAR